MSGLPLNHQMTALGGRFLREAHDRAGYRLHALGNRPGMVRAADGAAIAGEVWALPTAAIGALLAQVPRRLASARWSWTMAMPGLSGGSRGRRGARGHHRLRRLARLARDRRTDDERH